MTEMQNHLCPLNRCIYSLGSAFSLSLAVVLLPTVGHAKAKVKVEDFRLSGTTDIIISEAEMTQLLWRNLDARDRFEIYFSNSKLPRDSFSLIVEGSCRIKGENLFSLDWTVLRASGLGRHQFSFEGEDLGEVRQALFSSLDSLVVPISISTDPDSAGIVLDGIYRGKTPLEIDYFPIGLHHIEATTATGFTVKDSFVLTSRTTSFHFILNPETQKEEYAYLKILTPPVCYLYVDGLRRSPTHNNIYSLTPGEKSMRLVSPQYGTRDLTLTLVAGDTIRISFFNHRPQ